MAKQNDEAILALKEKIAIKKKELGAKPKFSPETNLVLDFRGYRHNLNVLTVLELQNLVVELTALDLASEDLDFEAKYNGYPVSDWLKDLKGKLAGFTYKAENDKLKALEIQLDKLLSADKQTELEIAKIADML